MQTSFDSIKLYSYILKIIFSKDQGPEVFGVAISQQTMKFQMAYLTSVDREERAALWPID